MRTGTQPIRFHIRYHAVLRPLLGLLGAGPAFSGVTVTATEIQAAMGWAFRARIPLHDVTAARGARIPLGYGIGVHGWAGRWAVNGARTGTVRIDIEPACRARVCGVPVRLRTLWVSLVDPAAFLAALAERGAAASS